MSTFPAVPVSFRIGDDGQSIIRFSDDHELDLSLPVRLTTYNGTKVEGQLLAPMNVIYRIDEPIIYQLYFQDGIQANWRPEYGELLEQVCL